MDVQTVQELLVWVISGGGAGAISYWAINEADKAGWLASWTRDAVRYLSLAVAAVLAVLAALAGMGLGYWPVPVGTTEWIETLFSVVAPAVLLSQTLHGALKLRGQSRG